MRRARTGDAAEALRRDIGRGGGIPVVVRLLEELDRRGEVRPDDRYAGYRVISAQAWGGVGIIVGSLDEVMLFGSRESAEAFAKQRAADAGSVHGDAAKVSEMTFWPRGGGVPDTSPPIDDPEALPCTAMVVVEGPGIHDTLWIDLAGDGFDDERFAGFAGRTSDDLRRAVAGGADARHAVALIRAIMREQRIGPGELRRVEADWLWHPRSAWVVAGVSEGDADFHVFVDREQAEAKYDDIVSRPPYDDAYPEASEFERVIHP